MKFTPEFCLGLLAFITSLVSIYYTHTGLQIQREHNIKSILPIGDISLGDYENNIFVRIDNNGIGPMIIKELKVFNLEVSGYNIIDLIPEEINQNITWTDFVSKVKNTAINPGNPLYLIHKEFTDNLIQNDVLLDIENRKELRECLSTFTVELTYTDVYSKNNYVITRNLDWFGRHQNINNEIKK
jgi:hypothetical protein